MKRVKKAKKGQKENEDESEKGEKVKITENRVSGGSANSRESEK